MPSVFLCSIWRLYNNFEMNIFFYNYCRRCIFSKTILKHILKNKLFAATNSRCTNLTWFIFFFFLICVLQVLVYGYCHYQGRPEKIKTFFIIEPCCISILSICTWFQLYNFFILFFFLILKQYADCNNCKITGRKMFV